MGLGNRWILQEEIQAKTGLHPRRSGPALDIESIQGPLRLKLSPKPLQESRWQHSLTRRAKNADANYATSLGIVVRATLRKTILVTALSNQTDARAIIA